MDDATGFDAANDEYELLGARQDDTAKHARFCRELLGVAADFASAPATVKKGVAFPAEEFRAALTAAMAELGFKCAAYADQHEVSDAADEAA
jgi:hypothetical protein